MTYERLLGIVPDVARKKWETLSNGSVTSSKLDAVGTEVLEWFDIQSHTMVSFRYLVFAPVRSGNGAKLSSAGLWLNASKPESVLETMMLVPHI